MEGEPKTNRNAKPSLAPFMSWIPLVAPIRTGVMLYVYTKVDTITTDSDTVTVTLSQTISLPLVGGTNPHSAQMAANKQFLFIGTDQSPSAVQVGKRTFSVTQLGGVHAAHQRFWNFW